MLLRWLLAGSHEKRPSGVRALLLFAVFFISSVARGTREFSGRSRRHISWPVAFVAHVSLCAFALDSDLAWAQGVHKDSPSSSHQVIQQIWTVQQGAPENIRAMAQTADGYLWLGGPGGLFRFDGTRFDRFHDASGNLLPSTNVYSLFAPSTGGLWVGYTFGGFSFINNGRVKNYAGEIASSTGSVLRFAGDPNGRTWAGTSNGIWRFDGSTWRHLGVQWDGPAGSVRIGFDRTGTLWAIASPTGFTGNNDKNKLLYLPAGSERFRVANEDMVYRGFTLDADGKVVTSPVVPQPAANSGPAAADRLQAYPIFGLEQDGGQTVDRTNSVWSEPLAKRGALLRVQTPSDLNGAAARANADNSETYDVHSYYGGSLVDREGNFWIAGGDGVHRFFYTSFSKQEIPYQGNSAIAADDAGAVWIGSSATSRSDGVYRVTDGKVERLAVPSLISWGFAYRATDKTFWFGENHGLWHLIRGKLSVVALPKELVDQVGYSQTITEDRAGGLWVSFGRRGLYRLADGLWASYGGHKDLPKTGVVIEFTDSLQRVWFGFTKNQVAVLDGEKVRVFGPGDGLQVGNVTAIYGRGSDIWIGGEFGLQKFDNGRFRSIHSADEDWLLGVSGIVETADGDLWLNGLTGIFHISRAEIAEALKDPSYRVRGEHIGVREGLPGFAAQIRPLPTAIEGSDGRLWFSLSSGLVWLDPTRARQQSAVPPLTIQSVSADDKGYEATSSLTFPAHTSSVAIRYSAISISDPEAVRSRVRLRETDADWHEVTTGEPVTYRNLAPGHYHFSVGVSDTNGVWSGKVANVDFRILPAWYQTYWFYIFCAVAFLALLWAVYQLRLRQVRLQFAAGLEQRVNERTRIARELHDTLLQSFQGAVFQIQAARNMLLRRADNAMAVLDEAILSAESGITEGRAAIRDLRPDPVGQRSLPELLEATGHELAENQELDGHSPDFRVIVEGKEQNLSLTLQEEIYKISREAIRNAFQHAAASHIEVEIRYDEDQLRLRIRDDGKGIDPKILKAGGQAGHWGLQGIRERAQRIGASVEFWSESGAGTELELTVAAAVAYEKRLNGRRFRLFH